jgi:hypothetical protein
VGEEKRRAVLRFAARERSRGRLHDPGAVEPRASSPSSPRRSSPLAKPDYVDKTFAPSLPRAAIFELADEHKTPIQTTSALRYTNVQDFVRKHGGTPAVKHMVHGAAGVVRLNTRFTPSSCS